MAAPDLLGHTSARIWTPPLITGPPGPCGCGCPHTRATTHGFFLEDFARDVLGEPLDPWERWAAIHALELLDDGRPRFRRVLVLVARQNGKTTLLKLLSLFWMLLLRVDLVLGTSTNLDYARESWEAAVALLEASEIADEIEKIRRTNGEQMLTLVSGSRYKIGTATRRGGRSLTVWRLICDELREHRTWDAYNAAYNAMRAVPTGQAWFISNAGDDTSIVLNDLRKKALRYIGDGTGDHRLGILEWSADPQLKITIPRGRSSIDIVPEALTAAILQANPNCGRRIDFDELYAEGVEALATGGEAETGYRTESLCQSVEKLDPALDIDAWMALGESEFPGLDHLRDRVAMAIDVNPPGTHAVLYAAAVDDDDRVLLDPVHHWTGPTARHDMSRDLPAIIAKTKPRLLGWFPSGPAAAVTADMKERKDRKWPPRGVKIEEIGIETRAVCMGFDAAMKAGTLRHGHDQLLDETIPIAERAKRGDGWVFVRSGTTGDIAALYAAAAAVHLARLAPRRRRSFAVGV